MSEYKFDYRTWIVFGIVLVLFVIGTTFRPYPDILTLFTGFGIGAMCMMFGMCLLHDKYINENQE